MAFKDEDFSDATFGRTVRRGSVIRHRRNSGTSNSQAESSHQVSSRSIQAQNPTLSRNIALPHRRAPAGGGVASAIAATSASAGVPHASSDAARGIRVQDPRPKMPADKEYKRMSLEMAFKLVELPTRPLVSPSRE